MTANQSGSSTGTPKTCSEVGVACGVVANVAPSSSPAAAQRDDLPRHGSLALDAGMVEIIDADGSSHYGSVGVPVLEGWLPLVMENVMRKSAALAVVVLAGVSAGCSTFFNASAPAAQPQQRYTVGSKQGFFTTESKVWLCPEGTGEPAECEEVQVNEK